MDVVELAMGHETALVDFLVDFEGSGEEDVPAYFADPGWSHAEIVQRFAAWSVSRPLAIPQ